MFYFRILDRRFRPFEVPDMFHWGLRIMVAAAVLTLTAVSYGQGGARFRSLGGERLRDVRAVDRQNWGTVQNSQFQNVPRAGYAPNGVVIRESAPLTENPSRLVSRPNAVSQNEGVGFSTPRSSSRGTVHSKRDGVQNVNSAQYEKDSLQPRGIDASIGSKREVSRAADTGGFSVSGVKKVVDSQASNGLLDKHEGKFDFIRAVKEDDLTAFVNESQGLCVVIPHKNFIIPASGNDEIGDKTSPSVASGTVAERGQESEVVSVGFEGDSIGDQPLTASSAFYNDYIVFTLTNLDPQETSLLKDSYDGRWDEFDLLNASLIAEGLTSLESRLHYRSRFNSLLANLLQQTDGLQDQLQKTEKVYNFLHSRALYSKYDLNCSSVAASLDSGVFNCVSATILFNCFASRAGLEVAALETTGHAKSRVKFEESFLDIETTCSSWNRLPDRMRPYRRSRADSDESVARGGIPAALERSDASETTNAADVSLNFVAVKSPSNAIAEEGSTTFSIDEEAPLGYSFTRSRRPMREISDVELVATIYYNVGVDYSQAGDYERSIASYIKAVQLAPENKTILGNLKATINNWAIDVAMKDKDYETAILLTDLGLRIDPDFREFNLNLPIFYHDWIELLVKAKKWDDVERVQNEYRKRFPE